MPVKLSRFCTALTLALSALGLQPALAQSAVGQIPATIDSLDLPRYMGTWYEIAKYPNWFQRKCTSNTVAQYSITDGGGVQVINRCEQKNGETTKAVGAARQLGAANSAKLEVRFAPAWLSFVPAVWGDYWVIDLDADYQLAAVSDAKRKYLWVLSRTPTVDGQAYEALRQRLAQQGFDLKKLVLSPQNQPPA